MIATGVDFMSPTGEQLVTWGANFRPSTLAGEWWRLLTCCFIHIGVLHLLMNMYALLYIGLLLEPRLGSIRFLTAYLVTGIAASTASLWWHPLTVSAGASGAIFGMYGVFLAMLTTNLIEKSTRKALLSSIAIFVGYNLLYGMKGGIDNAAHIGGLVSGLLAGYAFLPSLKNPSSRNLAYLTTAGFALVMVFGSITFAKSIRNDIGIYDEKIKTFSSRESVALEVYSLPESTPKDSLLYEIKERGIYNWNENIQLLNELEKLELPEAIHDRNKLLIEYCEVRIQSYNLMYNSVKEGTETDKDSIAFYNKKIEQLISSISSK
jgi:rhomboid protease GluP